MAIRHLRSATLASLAVALIFLEKDTSRPHHFYPQQQTTYVTSSGASLPTLFADLASNARIREAFRHPVVRKASTCRQNPGLMERITQALGLGAVVYAQGYCTDPTCYEGSPLAPCALAVQNIDCSECGSGTTTNWYLDFLNVAGYKIIGYGCGSTACDCSIEECMCK